MTDPKYEAECRAEFDKIGEDEVRKVVENGIIPEPKRQAGYRWLGERYRDRLGAEAEHRQNERKMAQWTRRLGILTVVLAVIAAISAWIAYEADQTSRLRDRALVYFGDPTITPYPPGNPTVWGVSINVLNAGNMPARRVTIRYACPNAPFSDEVSNTFGLVKEWGTAQSGSVIGPKQQLSLQGCNIPIDVITDAKSFVRHVFYLVEVTYLDGFYLSTTRITQVSRVFGFDRFGGQSLQFTTSRNCSDDDCPK